jgi:hypothetical protein
MRPGIREIGFGQAAYMRTVLGAPPYPMNPANNGYAWGGPSGTFLGILFMFGRMEGVV